MEEQVPGEPTVLRHRGPTASVDLIALIVAFPAELDERAAIPLRPPVVQPATNRDEPELTSPLPGELDEPGPGELDRVPIPVVHLHDPPPTSQALHRSSIHAVNAGQASLLAADSIADLSTTYSNRTKEAVVLNARLAQLGGDAFEAQLWDDIEVILTAT
jgi:hypothetical protein